MKNILRISAVLLVALIITSAVFLAIQKLPNIENFHNDWDLHQISKILYSVVEPLKSNSKTQTSPQNSSTTSLKFSQECPVLHSQISELLGEATPCREDSDCIVPTHLNCQSEFGCGRFLVNKRADLSIAEKGINLYQKKCSPCLNFCKRLPTPFELVCTNGMCVRTDYIDVYKIIEDTSFGVPTPVSGKAAPKNRLNHYQLWAAGLAGIVVEIDGMDHYKLELGSCGASDMYAYQNVLENWWSVKNRYDLLDTLDWVANEGHSTDFYGYARALAKFPDLSIASLTVDELYEKVPSFAEALTDLKFVEEYLPKLGAESLYGWDLGRFVFLCRAGYTAGYLTRPETLALIERAGVFVRNRFSNWEAFGMNYLIGRMFWRSDQKDTIWQETKPVYDALLSEEGFWDKTPWEYSREY